MGGQHHMAAWDWLEGMSKQVIHPNQVQAVQEEFSPSQERVQWATELIAGFDEYQKQGKL
ncbi:unnamed protein product [Coregonus sp. 'balchen']|nr:unnamed protein product [Coregonus sp. 'balchen']